MADTNDDDGPFLVLNERTPEGWAAWCFESELLDEYRRRYHQHTRENLRDFLHDLEQTLQKRHEDDSR